MTAATRSRRRAVATTSVVIVVVAVAFVGFRLYGAFSLLNRGDRIDLGGQEMFVLCEGSGSPTVLLEHGLGSSGVEWQAVQDRLAPTNLVCFRSRAGMGFSDPVPGNPVRTAADAADDLGRMVAEAEIPRPYVVVGHSFGGHVARLFVDRHRDDVVGMVLVDSTHERQVPLMNERLSAATWAEVSGLFGTDNPEHMDFAASGAQVSEVAALGDLPLSVLEADQQTTDADAAGISDRAAAEIDVAMQELWPRLQRDLASLSSVATHIRVGGSGHFIQKDHPEAVADAVAWVIEQD